MSLSPHLGPLPKYKIQANRARHHLKIECKCGCTKKSAKFGKHGGTAILTTKLNQKKIVACHPGHNTVMTDCCKTVKFFSKTKKTPCGGVVVKTLDKSLHTTYAEREHVVLAAKKTTLKRTKEWWILMHYNNVTRTFTCPKCGSNHPNIEAPNQKWVKVAKSGTFVKLKTKPPAQHPSALDLFLADAKQQGAQGKPPRFEKLYSLNPTILCDKLNAITPKDASA